jgi:hypothetical protein
VSITYTEIHDKIGALLRQCSPSHLRHIRDVAIYAILQEKGVAHEKDKQSFYGEEDLEKAIEVASRRPRFGKAIVLPTQVDRPAIVEAKATTNPNDYPLCVVEFGKEARLATPEEEAAFVEAKHAAKVVEAKE